MINNTNDFPKEIEYRKRIEKNEILKNAYQLRINKTENYLN